MAPDISAGRFRADPDFLSKINYFLRISLDVLNELQYNLYRRKLKHIFNQIVTYQNGYPNKYQPLLNYQP